MSSGGGGMVVVQNTEPAEVAVVGVVEKAAQASTSITTTILSIKHGIRSNFNGVVPIIAYIVLFLLVAHDALSQQKQT